jgi:hypothetical protein
MKRTRFIADNAAQQDLSQFHGSGSTHHQAISALRSGQRSSFRIMSFSHDHVSSTAPTFTPTSPRASAISWIRSSAMAAGS